MPYEFVFVLMCKVIFLFVAVLLLRHFYSDLVGSRLQVQELLCSMVFSHFSPMIFFCAGAFIQHVFFLVVSRNRKQMNAQTQGGPKTAMWSGSGSKPLRQF